uniref:Hydroxysteroid dehydrogenase-like protein 2 n=1 Tax=Arcella intermedia TaxID=1963864 RepID=A0A6B2LBI1_9EUKA
MKGRVAIVTGGSRGIGRECCLALARYGCAVVVAAKSTEDQKNLPGTIYSVAEEVRALGSEAMAVKVDMRSEEEVTAAVQEVVKRFGRIDILINNASALWWHDIVDTPIKKYDLINAINSRGTFIMTRACLPHMQLNKFGRVITMSPPIRFDQFAGHTAYNISKYGMTMVALGVAQEYAGKGITGNSLWPATVVESLASRNFKLGDEKLWRKATILADAVLAIATEGDSFTGNMLIDDLYLKSKGLTDKDLEIYRCDPTFDPPRVLDSPLDTTSYNILMTRGDVKQLEKDMARAKL